MDSLALVVFHSDAHILGKCLCSPGTGAVLLFQCLVKTTSDSSKHCHVQDLKDLVRPTAGSCLPISQPDSHLKGVTH